MAHVDTGFVGGVCIRCLCPCTGRWQVAITGTVMDPSGAVLPGAKITVTEKSTSVARVDRDERKRAVQHSVPSSVNLYGFGGGGGLQEVCSGRCHARRPDPDMDIHLEVGATTQQVTVASVGRAGQHGVTGLGTGN